MGAEFEHHRVDKTYLGLARGWLPDKGTIDHPIADEENNEPPRSATTHFQCLARTEVDVCVDRYPTSRYSLAHIWPQTGRRHQIRKHFRHISHHLIGDTTHGKGTHNRFFREKFKIHRLLLCATQLRFQHPLTNRPIEINAHQEAVWIQLEEALDWELVDSPGCSE